MAPSDSQQPLELSGRRDGNSKSRRRLSRDQGKLLVLSGASIACLYLTFRLIAPFLPAIVWAIAGAVVTRPLSTRLERWLGAGRWPALVLVSLVGLGLFVPSLLLIYFGTVQVEEAVHQWQSSDYFARLQAIVTDHPRLASLWNGVSENVDLSSAFQQVVDQVQRGTAAIVSGFAYTLIQVFIALFILFYLYRDHARALETLRRLCPLTDRETDKLLSRVADTIHATLFGTLIVALIQGLLGGLMFWMLSLPTPVLWGTVMGALAIIPYLGAFVVWVPASAFLMIEGAWVKGLVLATWGLIVIGLIDNLLYPIFVGNRLRQHTVVAFVAILGGIAVFGATGILLGPVIVTLTIFLLEIWRERTRNSRNSTQLQLEHHRSTSS